MGIEENPTISVIVPVYKAEHYLRRCVDSILAQTLTDFELLLVDDGSPDGSGAICDEYAMADARVHVFHKENGGVSSARNVGLDHARGEWVAFVDADDWVDPDYLQTYYKSRHGSGFVLGRVEYEGKEIIHLPTSVVSGANMVYFIIKNKCLEQTTPFCRLFCMDIIRKNELSFPLGIHYGEDAIFFICYMNCIDRISVIDYCGYNYSIVEGSLSKKYNSFKSEWLCFTLWKRAMDAFVSKCGENVKTSKTMVWNNRIGETFMRCFHCVLRPQFVSYKFAKSCLDSIPQTIYDEFNSYFQAVGLNYRIIKYLIVNRCFYTLRILDRIYGCLHS